MSIANVVAPALLMATKRWFGILVGVHVLVVLPMPSCPRVLSPTAQAWPEESRKNVEPLPLTMLRTVTPPKLSLVGVSGEVVALPIPVSHLLFGP